MTEADGRPLLTTGQALRLIGYTKPDPAPLFRAGLSPAGRVGNAYRWDAAAVAILAVSKSESPGRGSRPGDKRTAGAHAGDVPEGMWTRDQVRKYLGYQRVNSTATWLKARGIKRAGMTARPEDGGVAYYRVSDIVKAPKVLPLPERCRAGHELTEENISVASNGKRQCRECRREVGRRVARQRWGNRTG